MYLKKIAKFIVNMFTAILLLILILIVYGKLTVTFSEKAYPNYFGYTFFEVASGSMKPTLDVNDVIIIKINNKKIKKNDIIAFEYDNAIITHRVLYINGDDIVVKGDNNNAIDKPIKINQVIGTMVKKYPKLGLWKKVLMDPKIIIALFVTLLLFDFALSYNKQGIEKKNKDNNLKKAASDNVLINKIDWTEKNDFKDKEKLLEFTRKIDISEINKLIDDPSFRLNKKEIDNIKSEIKKVEEKGIESTIDLSNREKKFLEYTIRLDLNEIKNRIDAKIK